MDQFEFNLLIGAIALCVIMLALTGVGILTICALFILAGVFGKHKAIAFVGLSAGGLLTAWQLFTGELQIILIYLWQAYRDAGSSGIINIWSRAALRVDAWLALSPPSLVLGGALLLFYLDYRDSPLRALTAVAGKPRIRLAPWMRLKIARRLKTTTALTNGALLGIDSTSGRRVTLTKEQLNLHTVLVGRSGAGKTTTLLNLIEFAINAGIPIFFLDGKGERDLGDRICRLGRERGRPTYLIDVNDPAGSSAYNPFADKSHSAKADCIIALRRQWTEEHYELLASDHIQMVFLVLDRVGIKPTLLQLPNYLSTRTLLGLVRRAKLRRAEAQYLADQISQLAINEAKAVESLRSSIRALAGASFSGIFDLALATRLNTPILELAKARREKAVVYVGIDVLTLSKVGPRFAHLLINDLKNAIAGGEGLFLLAFDEFASFAGPQVANIINMGRSHGACGVIASQSLADFQLPEYPKFLEQLIGSASNYIFHQLNVPSDAELAASIIGTAVGAEYTAQMAGQQPTGASSVRAVHEFEIHPQQLKTLKRGEAYVFSKSEGLVCPRVKIRESEI
jgi:type IV secretory pathway TraG/TraD family ATPase VirD4